MSKVNVIVADVLVIGEESAVVSVIAEAINEALKRNGITANLEGECNISSSEEDWNDKLNAVIDSEHYVGVSVLNTHIEVAKKILESNGYLSELLWSVNDVRSKVSGETHITDKECLEILKGVLNSEYFVGEVNSAIKDELYSRGHVAG